MPDYPEFSDPEFRTVALDESESTATSAPRMILGTLDDTHFPWIHEGILGTRDKAAPPDHTVERQGDTLVTQYHTTQPPNHATTDLSKGGDITAAVSVRYTNFVSMPNVIRLVKEGAAGRYVIWLATCPVAYNVTKNFWAFSRDYDLDPAKDEQYIAFSQVVRDQDKPIIESQRPVLVPPLSAGVSLPMSPADAPLIEYVRWLDELGVTCSPQYAS
ncbi:MAG: hypothetical protein HOI95_26775 [Chromatiales bacterium]|nr:hypothetical protein [Chromatiales bacterium]